MRLHADLESALSGDMLAAYRQQIADVRGYVTGQPPETALHLLREAMVSLFRDALGLDAAAAAALARLATELPPADSRRSPVEAAAERCALQRALVASGHGAEVRSYFGAAARGAAEGFGLDRAAVAVAAVSAPSGDVVAASGSASAPRIPTLRRPPAQEVSLDGVKASALFTERMP